MSKYKVDDTQLAAIAESIRAKTGSSDLLEFPADFISKVNGITAKIRHTSSTIKFRAEGSISGIVVQPGQMVQLSSTAYASNYYGPLQSFSFQYNFSGKDNIELYTKVVTNRNRYFAYNKGSSNVTIPGDIQITCVHYLNSAYI